MRSWNSDASDPRAPSSAITASAPAPAAASAPITAPALPATDSTRAASGVGAAAGGAATVAPDFSPGFGVRKLPLGAIARRYHRAGQPALSPPHQGDAKEPPSAGHRVSGGERTQRGCQRLHVIR